MYVQAFLTVMKSIFTSTAFLEIISLGVLCWLGLAFMGLMYQLFEPIFCLIFMSVKCGIKLFKLSFVSTKHKLSIVTSYLDNLLKNKLAAMQVQTEQAKKNKKVAVTKIEVESSNNKSKDAITQPIIDQSLIEKIANPVNIEKQLPTNEEESFMDHIENAPIPEYVPSPYEDESQEERAYGLDEYIPADVNLEREEKVISLDTKKMTKKDLNKELDNVEVEVIGVVPKNNVLVAKAKYKNTIYEIDLGKFGIELKSIDEKRKVKITTKGNEVIRASAI